MRRSREIGWGRVSAGLILALAAPGLAGFDCGSATLGPNAIGSTGSSGGSAAPPDDGGGDVTRWTASSGVTIAVGASPFTFSIADKNGNVLLESAKRDVALAADDPLRAYAPLAITHDTDESGPTLAYGWAYFRGVDDPWKEAATIASVEFAADRFVVHLTTTDAALPSLTLTLTSQDSGVHLVAAIDRRDPNDASPVNRVSLALAMHDDDHFMGFGERYVYADRRGTLTYDWVEEDGLGAGEETPISASNPSPNGPGMTHIPVPWFMNPRGFGLLANTTFRSNFHLGEERADAFRIESTTGTLDLSIFASPDPPALLASLTAVTGRPPPIADWALAPRRRADPGSPDVARLRDAHIPTSVIDSDVHYFPNGGGADHQAMQAITADLHARGYKAVAYFCTFVADSWHPVYDDAVANGYLVKHADGTPYVVLDPPYNAGMVNFTNPAAVAWYQGYMQQAVADGWDGWMYDFGEYVPQDAVMFDGTGGLQAHNEYPILYQQAALAMFQKAVPSGDFLFFARSGYAGTGGAVPMVWAGDQATDFDLAQGLPAALTGALNAGMSGIPLWGSDISGFHYLYNPPPDKEVYLRWTQGAFSADMHDENEGVGEGTAPRWQIWDDQESIDVYRRYALLKTRMLPYVRVAVREARATGMPVMRHMYLANPTDPRVYTMQDEYMYGDSLLVAPVVARGLTSRSVYLPESTYFDYWTGARVTGRAEVVAEAPLDKVPVFALLGAIIPMLAPDVETVVPAGESGVVSLQDRAGFLEVQVFAGGTSTLALDDGTVFAQSAPVTAFDPGTSISRAAGAIPMAASIADLQTCDACAWNDPASHVLSIAVVTARDTIVAGPLTVGVSESPSVKRYLFTIRH